MATWPLLHTYTPLRVAAGTSLVLVRLLNVGTLPMLAHMFDVGTSLVLVRVFKMLAFFSRGSHTACLAWKYVDITPPHAGLHSTLYDCAGGTITSLHR